MNTKKPEWVPEDAGREFTTNVMPGVVGGHDGLPGKTGDADAMRISRRREPTVAEYVEGVLRGDRMLLGRAITLVESNSAKHIEKAQEVLQQLLPHSGKSIRIGITGVPGAGKSTFIESFGGYLSKAEHRTAVLAVDPSSTLTKGSILGDKTRMELLSRDPRCFIRPSPSGGALGGVTRKTRETIILCEAAGFDIILVETVGVGQSEVTVRSMVDFFLLLHIAGAGDDLQGIKKGVMELADAVVVNKADGDNRIPAERARTMLENVLGFLTPSNPEWQPPALTCSALTGTGIPEVWEHIVHYTDRMRSSGYFELHRHEQDRQWMHTMLDEHLLSTFYHHPGVDRRLREFETSVVRGELPVTRAVHELLQFWDEIRDSAK